MDDLISRQAAIAYAISGRTREFEGEKWIRVSEVRESLKTLPPAQPDFKFDEWCIDCKEYDHERNCCPRWNRVIRDTLQDVQAEQPEIVRCKDCKHRPKKNEYSSDLEFPDDECICQCADYYYDWMPEDDFYCARGERRAEDD